MAGWLAMTASVKQYQYWHNNITGKDDTESNQGICERPNTTAVEQVDGQDEDETDADHPELNQLAVEPRCSETIPHIR